tara:strand:- start:4252 stop:5490 length:1239 start_codon:yes stop_codon:yes gene_type:complete
MEDPKNPKLEDVAMYKIKLKKSNILLGESGIKNLIKEPFDINICSFLNDLSESLMKDRESNKYKDLKSLAFWCRKSNILRLKKKNNSQHLRIGKGLVFHITPSNVPTNFFYSLLFGLLSGNSNIVKISSRNFEQVRIIIKLLKKILRKKIYKEIKKMITIIKYENDTDLTQYLSSICDLRVIWGGDNTINEIRKFPLKTLATDICFADRFSFSIIDTDKLFKIRNKIEMKQLINHFFNETMIMDQNACTTPHLILWKGKNNNQTIKDFWMQLSNKIKDEYIFPELAMIDKYTQYCIDVSNKNFFKNISIYNKFLYVVDLKQLNNELSNLRGKWGYFYQFNIKNLNQVAPFVNRKFQTLSYFGFTAEEIKNFISKNKVNGIDRAVPIGQGLSIDLLWDGYDIINSFSRNIDII